MTDMRPWQPITYSCKDTPETRKQVLAHDSVYDSQAAGKRRIVSDNCPDPKPDKKPDKTS